ncbi:hypothetical protein [Dyadobacter pollutisoli]|uniref:Uncharacterized protein n=1 Tax=Dyadobacter pollutisoli TaxID=2910158 RepID=A0A9E8NH09_9BACT|nr:hypothetical protein [Dyadobacter pollutisoli]WAC14112.1 hypothetical protein ON006_09135 [Dyadobacter pollutisoli]
MSEKAPFDRKTLERLKNYNIPYREGSWDNFEAFRKKKEDKKRLFFFFYKIAATLFLALAVGWGVNKLVGNSKRTVAEKQIHTKKQTKTIEDPPADSIQSLPDFRLTSKAEIKIDQSHLNLVSRNKKSLLTTSAPKNLPDFTADKFTDHSTAETAINSGTDIVFQQDPNFAVLNARSFSYLSIYIKKPSIPFKTNDLREEMPNHKSRPGYSMVLNQHVNSATSSLPGYSFGLGGLADIPLTRKIELSTGLSLGRQSLRIQKEKLPFNPATSGTPHLDRVDYRWANAEIPINVRYRMMPTRKWNIYVSGGLSMLGTFGQKFDYAYSNSRILTTVVEAENGPVVVSTQTLEEKSVVRDERVRDKIGFGSTVNVALGFDYPWKAANLSVEPFVRYPIGSITSERLQFFSLGIQLRWSIISPRLLLPELRVNSKSQTE